MSIELVTRLWLGDEVPARVQLTNLMQIFESRGIEEASWKGLTVRDSNLSRKIFQSQELMSSIQVETALADYDKADLHFSIRSALPCFRFKGMTPQKGFVPLWVEAWGKEFNESVGRCREIEGDAAFSLADSGPFIALIEHEETLQVQQVNQCVEENLDKVTEIILTIAECIKPMTMKAFTAKGLYQPLNAHLVFFRDSFSLIDDLKLIRKLWNEGLPNYRTAPLRESVNKPDLLAFHPWRGMESTSALVSRLAAAMDSVHYLNHTCLETIDWKHYDNYESSGGRVVLDYPFWVNSFLDHFYLDLFNAQSKE